MSDFIPVNKLPDPATSNEWGGMVRFVDRRDVAPTPLIEQVAHENEYTDATKVDVPVQIPDVDVFAGGDPAMGSIGTGSNYQESLAAQKAIEVARAASGGTLTAEQENIVLQNYPGADTSIATGPAHAAQAANAVGKFVTNLPRTILGAVPWWVWGLGAIAVVVYLRHLGLLPALFGSKQ